MDTVFELAKSAGYHRIVVAKGPDSGERFIVERIEFGEDEMSGTAYGYVCYADDTCRFCILVDAGEPVWRLVRTCREYIYSAWSGERFDGEAM